MTQKELEPDLHIAHLQGDIARWHEEIELVNIELIFYKNLVSAHQKEQNSWNAADYQNLLGSIADIQEYNKNYQRQFLKFSNELHKMDECQDLQCEAHFARNYYAFKDEIEGHFTRYKQFKRNLFTFLKTRYHY